MKTRMPYQLQFFAEGGEGEGTQSQLLSIDYDKIQKMLDGTLKAKEDTALKAYFKQQGLSEEEMSHLHSNMYLFIHQDRLQIYHKISEFTFQYVSIHSVTAEELNVRTWAFTFQYVSIHSWKKTGMKPLHYHLHSNMYLFIHNKNR